ncbi:GntR family transcriptional regulator [uncultured Algibacter sp.]|uniref:GntR family transcriptional regulator n=1 Tax=uncultured Algibacter sp. TaxID=298659 RepID=UPI00321634A8
MITINNKLGIPKYKQIISSVEKAILAGHLKKGSQLPSINGIKNTHKLSRDTVLMAFNELKNRGIIHSIVGKGYYVSSIDVNITQKVFLLFDELNAFKEDLYNAFLAHLGENIQVDIFFHHFNKNIFSKLIHDNCGDYNAYVIMPANLINTASIIEVLPKEHVYILDQIHDDLSQYPAIYQNFEKSVFNSLTNAHQLIKKYNKLILAFSKDKQPQGMLKGFTSFCKKNSISFDVLSSLQNRIPKKGELYIIPDDINLLRIIKQAKSQNVSLSKDFGIISYNDTLLKELVEGGITTISTDFNLMGKRLAEMLLNKDLSKIENPTKLIIRNSL